VNARARTAAAGIACLAVALPSTAQARTKTVAMGAPTQKVANHFQKLGSEVNDFFPHGVTIHVGGKVRFVPTEFHTVELPKRSGPVVPLISPTGQKATGTDAAGRPFWFNGTADQLSFSPALLKSRFGKHLRYSGRKAILSGIPLAPALKPMTVRFTKTGRYKFFCNIHAGMKGFVRVRARSKRIPSKAQDARTLKNEISRDVKIAKELAKTEPPANTVDVGAAGPHGVEYLAMFPLQPLTVHVGDGVTFRMTRGSFEDHTATFAPGDPSDTSTYLGQLAATFQGAGPFDSRAVYPSEPPGGAQATFTPLLHGNGFWNAGVMDRSNATRLPSFNSVSFGAPGDFNFYCLIHPFMRGTIHVVP
jgi:plastocyanin